VKRITPKDKNGYSLPTHVEKELLTVSEISEQYGLHPNTVRGYYRSGQLPAVNLGPRMIRIRRSDIEQLLTPYQAEASVWARPVR
jgi:excisionase family DNA binding protein